jgi:hypothetical protein
VLVAAGTTVHFTELNRNREVATGAEALLFPSCPTVHMTDDTTVAENLGALPFIADTTASFSTARVLGLSPVGLRKPPRPPPRFAAEDLSAPPRYADARQGSLFLAGWTAGHFGQAARAGFRRVTYYQATGWRGLLPGDVAPAPAFPFPVEPGGVFPVYHLLADLADWAGGAVLPSRSSAPIEVEGVALGRGGSRGILLANLTREPRSVRLPVWARGARLRRLDAASAAQATRDPSGFRAAAAAATLPGAEIVLGPHELARIDAGD